jgi:hypothetical protein
VQVTNLAGVAASSNALLTVLEPPFITSQPLGLAVAAGSNVTFNVVATGTKPLTYQWEINGSNIVGATVAALSRTNVQSADAGSYSVMVSNAAGFALSDLAILTVNNAPVLLAISNLTIHAGSTIVITNVATDSDIPPQTLTFSLETGAPAGATIDAATGVFAWGTTLFEASTTNTLTVRVTDNGIPSLADAKSFVVTVLAPLTIGFIIVSNSTVSISWDAIPGTTYRLQYEDNLDNNQWISLTPDVTATGPSAGATDTLASNRRFYRVMLIR